MVAHRLLLSMVGQLLMVGGQPLRQACSGSKTAHFEHRKEQVTLAVVDPRVVQLVDQVLHRDVARVKPMHQLVSLWSRQELCVQGHTGQVLHL